jgi:hypothetical protein
MIKKKNNNQEISTIFNIKNKTKSNENENGWNWRKKI